MFIGMATCSSLEVCTTACVSGRLCSSNRGYESYSKQNFMEEWGMCIMPRRLPHAPPVRHRFLPHLLRALGLGDYRLAKLGVAPLDMQLCAYEFSLV